MPARTSLSWIVATAGVLVLSACGRTDESSPVPPAGTDVATPSSAASPPAPPTVANPEPASGAAAAAASASVGPGVVSPMDTASVDGAAVYNQACVVCHGAGVAGAPKIGDKADWAPRIAQGMDTLYAHSINGYQGKKGVMPPRGGSNKSDAEVRAAVDHMVSQSR